MEAVGAAGKFEHELAGGRIDLDAAFEHEIADPMVVAPHFMAQGLIDALIENGFVHKTAYAEYAHAGIEATKLIAPATSDPDAWVAWMKAAMNRWENH